MMHYDIPWLGKMPDEEYHGKNMQEYVSSTMLKTLAHSPAHLRHMLDNPSAKDTDALRCGRAIHCAILDGPQEFVRQYRVKKKANWATVAGKSEKAAMLADRVTPLTVDEHAMVMGILRAFESHPEIMNMIDDNPQFEQTILWRDEETGLLCRAKPDVFGGNFMVDLKSARDARPAKFNRQFFDLGYHIQAAHYAAAWKAITGWDTADDLYFVFFAAEKTPPFGNLLYHVPYEVTRYGMKERRELMLKYKDCVDKNEWPGYGHEIHELTLPYDVGSDYDDDDCE